MSEGKPCGGDYAMRTSVTDTTLELTVVQTASRTGDCALTELICCERTFTAEVPEGIDRVRDMGRAANRPDMSSAGIYFLERPAGVLDLIHLPEGWSKTSERASWGGTWTQFYGPSPDSRALEFRTWPQGELNSEPEYLQPPVMVNGHEAEYSLYADTGEIALQWMDGETALMLAAMQSDFKVEELIAVAESASPAPPPGLTSDEAVAKARKALGSSDRDDGLATRVVRSDSRLPLQFPHQKAISAPG